jgi:hypothetical protein
MLENHSNNREILKSIVATDLSQKCLEAGLQVTRLETDPPPLP